MSAIVSLRNVVKRYTRGKQQVEVLHSLNLDIPEGGVPRPEWDRRAPARPPS